MARNYFKSRVAPQDQDTDQSLLAKLLKLLGPGSGNKVILTGTTENTSGPYYKIQANGAADLVIDELTAADWNGGSKITQDITLKDNNFITSDKGFTQVKLGSGIAILYKM